MDMEKAEILFDESYEALLEFAKAEAEGGIEAGLSVIESFSDDILSGIMAHLMTLIILENPPVIVELRLKAWLRRLHIEQIERLRNRGSQQ